MGCGLPAGVCGCSSSVCYVLCASSFRVLSPGEEAVTSFWSLDLWMEGELNCHSAAAPGMDCSTKQVLALEADQC